MVHRLQFRRWASRLLRAGTGSAVIVLLLFVAAGCKGKSAASERRFHLHGTVVSVDVKQGFAQIDSDAIPGFMDAMTMPYQIPDPSVLSTLKPGDEIAADLVVTGEGGHLEHVSILKHGGPRPAPSSSFHAPKPGDPVPDFIVRDQYGRSLHLKSFRGKALLVTFIYTRCPYADFCPKVSSNFAEMYRAIARQPALASSVRLLSVSFDYKNDTPRVLRAYAASFRKVSGAKQPFAVWDFATARPKELPAMARFFGLYYSSEQGQIIHSLSTSLISPDGKVVEWFHDNDWQPATLLADAAKTLSAPQHARAARPPGASRS
jgi:protein SCO1